MKPCEHNGRYTCISRNGVPKKSYDTDKQAINTAKILNENNLDSVTKLVAYKCSYCGKFHLTSHFKRIRKNKNQ